MACYNVNDASELLFELSDEEDDLDKIYSTDAESDNDEYFSPSTQPAFETKSSVLQDIDKTSNAIDISESDNDNQFLETEEPPRKRHKLSMSKKLIHSIDSALDSNNYNQLDISNIQKETYDVVITKPSARSSGDKIAWTNEPPLCSGRQSAINVISGPVGVCAEAKTLKNPREVWELFFSADILSLVEMTNKKIATVRSSLDKKILDDSRYTYIGLTNFREILAFIGLMYLRGLLGLCNHDVKRLFHKLSGNPIFGATMSKNRFKFLFAHLMIIVLDQNVGSMIDLPGFEIFFKNFALTAANILCQTIICLWMKLFIQCGPKLHFDSSIRANQQNMDYFLNQLMYVDTRTHSRLSSILADHVSLNLRLRNYANFMFEERRKR